MSVSVQTHTTLIGYALWVVGFTGSHRFYYGEPVAVLPE
jgi:TM2 domain-containing membrane protein YozV